MLSDTAYRRCLRAMDGKNELLSSIDDNRNLDQNQKKVEQNSDYGSELNAYSKPELGKAKSEFVSVQKVRSQLGVGDNVPLVKIEDNMRNLVEYSRHKTPIQRSYDKAA